DDRDAVAPLDRPGVRSARVEGEIHGPELGDESRVPVRLDPRAGAAALRADRLRVELEEAQLAARAAVAGEVLGADEPGGRHAPGIRARGDRDLDPARDRSPAEPQRRRGDDAQSRAV